MKILCTLHHCKDYGYQTFAENKNFMIKRFGDDVMDYLMELGDVIEKKTTCNELVFDAWTGSYEYFLVSFRKDGEKICWVQITRPSHGMRKLYNYDHEVKGVLDKSVIEEVKMFINLKNQEKYRSQFNLCGIGKDNKIIVDIYEDYKKAGEKTLAGTWEEVVDQFVTYNDRMRYCNGSYWRFNNKDVEELYSMFISNYDGNYFLDNAVKRGVIID